MVPVLMILSDLWFQDHDIIQRQITLKWYNIELYLQQRTNRKSNMIYRTAPFSMTLNDPYPRFHGHAILTLNIWETVRYTNINIIITYTRPTQQCRFEWPWVILNDLAKFLMTKGAARSLCDSWASCYNNSSYFWSSYVKIL